MKAHRFSFWTENSVETRTRSVFMDWALILLMLSICFAVTMQLYMHPRTSKAPLTFEEIATMDISPCGVEEAISQIVQKRVLSPESMAFAELQCLSGAPRDAVLQRQMNALKKYHPH